MLLLPGPVDVLISWVVAFFSDYKVNVSYKAIHWFLSLVFLRSEVTEHPCRTRCPCWGEICWIDSCWHTDLILWFKDHLQLRSPLLNTSRIHTVCAVFRRSSTVVLVLPVCVEDSKRSAKYHSLCQGGYVFSPSCAGLKTTAWISTKLVGKMGKRAKPRTHWKLVQSWMTGRIQDLFSAVNRCWS